MAEKDTKPKVKTTSTTAKTNTAVKPAAKTTAKPAASAKAAAGASKTAVAAKTTAEPKKAAPAKEVKPAAETKKAAPAKEVKPAAEPKKVAPAKEVKAPAETKKVAPAKEVKPAAETKKAAPAKEAKTTAETKKAASAESAKDKKKNKNKNGGFKNEVKAFFSNKKLVAIVSSCVAALLIAIIVLSVCLGVKCNSSQPFKPVDAANYNYDRFDDDANFNKTGPDRNEWAGVEYTKVTGGYEKGTSRAPQTSEVIRTLSSNEIVKPVEGTRDEREKYGVKTYPTYGSSLKGYTKEERDGIFAESTSLSPSPTWRSQGIYNAIDSEGYLLKNGNKVSDGNGGYKQLYAHTASVSNYGGGLTDDEHRIVKKITAYTHMKLESTQLTGLYAPAGEVIKIEMSKNDYSTAGGLRVLIGQNYNLYQHVAMETSGDGIKGTGLNRMTDLLSIFEYNDKNGAVNVNGDTVTFYVGSFLGGPIYFRPIKNDVERNISVTISGGVRYQHFILGVTTEEEYKENAKSTAPFFDLEVYESIRFTLPRKSSSHDLTKMTYRDCTDAAVLWDKIAEVSTRVGPNGLSGASAPIYVIGDCYVAAGEAFANPGRNGVVCPLYWFSGWGPLNYNSFVNGGNWGTMHEYNHCWQGYGLAANGEVTNNATTLVSYSLYTRISQGRTSAPGWGNGGWNRFTDPSKALGELLSLGKDGSKRFDLSVYATLLHNIGQENYIEAAHGGSYYDNLVNATHYDMTYYFRDVLNFGIGNAYDSNGTISKDKVNEAKDKNYPMFVPVASVYQVGRSIIRDGKKQYITTAQPFAYGRGELTMDFNNKNNFAAGSFVSKELVIPDGFTVKVVEVTQPENGKVEMLENNLVKYTPKSGKDGLYSGNFRVKLRIVKNNLEFIVEDVDLVINLKQSTANTTLNRTTYVYDEAQKVPATNSVYNAQTGKFDFGEYAETETRKNVCTQETNTQIWQAGWNYDDDVYDKNSTNYRVMPLNRTLQTMEGVMYFSSAGNYRFTLKGRGVATLYLSYDGGKTWENALTISRTSGNAYDNSVYSEHTFSESKNYVYFKVVLLVTKESDFFGVGTSKQNTDGSYPAFSNASNAITSDTVEFDKVLKDDSEKKFETEYLYKNEYTYGYARENKVYASGTKLVSVSHESWDNTVPIANMFDGKSDTYYHSKGGEANYITEAKPFELVVDFGSARTVNRVTFNGYKNSAGNNGMVKDFKIYGSTDGVNYSLVTEVTDSPANAKNMTFNFDTVNIRYYKLVVTKTDNGRYFAMNSIVFSDYLAYTNGKIVSPSDFNVRYIGEWNTENRLCNFGLVYTAKAGSSLEYHFTGSRVAYFANRSEEYGTVDIYIDGKLVAENVDLSADNYAGTTSTLYDRYNYKYVADPLAYIYTGDALSDGEHVLKIVGKSGTFNVESFACWN
ncbi:MAG: discoidin domain-containing protein [Clostridia bacterium]|nr:discoidin domain-containing protein [Clostridia bacterium]